VTPLPRPRATHLWPLFIALATCRPPATTNATPPPASTTSFSTSAAPPLEDIAPDPRERLLARGIEQLLTAQHLRGRPIDDGLSREAFAEFIERLDGGKVFLLASHHQQLERYTTEMDDQLRRGDLELARTGAAMLARRRGVVAKMIADILSRPLDFTNQEQLETDAKKRAFCTTDQELADRWRKILELQMLEAIVGMEDKAEARTKAKSEGKEPPVGSPDDELPATAAGREKKAREELAKRLASRFTRLDDSDALEPATRFINAVAAIYDPHTSYLPPADRDNFDIAMSGSLEGIGAVLSEEDSYIAVREVVPGGAAWRQGKLKAGDLITAVAQQGKPAVDVTDMPINRVVAMIRGPKGTVVALNVRKPDGAMMEIAIKRDVVEIEAAFARGAVIDRPSGSVGYIHLPSFYGSFESRPGAKPERNATSDVRKLLEVFDKRKLAGVVLDLRGNGGGLLGHAQDITGLFVDSGPVVQTRYADGKRDILLDKDGSVSFKDAVVVLVDRHSASASEIVAGALQDYRRAVVVGAGATHGKGTVQAVVNLEQLQRLHGGGPPLGIFKITVQQFFRITGDSTQWRGVVPDVLLPDPTSHVDSDERSLDHSIPWSEIQPLPFTPWSGARWNLSALAAASKQRQAAQPVFSTIEARSAFLVSRRDDTVVPLHEQTWRARRKADQAALDKLDPKLDEGKPRHKATFVDYAGSPAPTNADGRSVNDEWRETLEHDPWVEETLHVLDDVIATSR
jgi:carboxyl-terminal processing protease